MIQNIKIITIGKGFVMKISEIFYSLQGEGNNVGVPSIFVRFYGCNLACEFCDEPLHKNRYKNMSKEDILDEIKKYPSKQVVLTGGEPSLNDLNDFIDFLHQGGYKVCVETNGFNIENIKNADWITCSPKANQKIVHHKISEYKMVVNQETDIKNVLFYTQYGDVYIQPMNNKNSVDKDNLKFCIDLVLKYPNLKLSLQVHKIINIA